MIQPARKPKSLSLLREIKDAIIVLPSEELRADLLEELAQIISKQKENSKAKSGLLGFKKRLISHLKDLGEIKTANLWCRNISLNENDIIELEQILFKELLDNGCYGVAEIHLQDREINSPHIQYVGTNCEVAEQVVANIVVNLGYEIDIESSMSKKNFRPFYEVVDRGIIQLDLEKEMTNAKTAKEIVEYEQKSQKRVSKADIDRLIKDSKRSFIADIQNHSSNKIDDFLKQYREKKRVKGSKYAIKNNRARLRAFRRRRK